ncbi:MAG: hypothetical protein IJA12_03720 [Oscillospiraceae bacterium]|nr:hypothetical protein [Oscillospiraceae bacterium]
MERKRKIRRASILIMSVYIFVNIFVFGLMKAYMNTNNIISKNRLVMASVTETENRTNIEILGKSFEINTQDNIKKFSQLAVYALMNDKARVCTDIILNAVSYLPEI